MLRTCILHTNGCQSPLDTLRQDCVNMASLMKEFWDIQLRKIDISNFKIDEEILRKTNYLQFEQRLVRLIVKRGLNTELVKLKTARDVE